MQKQTRTWLMIVTGLCLASLCQPAHADIYMKYKQHTEPFQMMGKTQPAKDEIRETWITKDMIRSDTKESTVIMRVDQKRIYHINHQNKTYMEMPLEMDKIAEKAIDEKKISAQEKAKAKQFMQGMMQNMTKMQATVTETNEKKKIGKWNCTKYLQKMTTPMGPSESEIWATAEIKMDTDLANRMQAAGIMAMPGMQATMEDLIKEMKKMKGVPVLTISTSNVMNTSVKSTHELMEQAEKQVPTDFYAPPKGYNKQTM